MAFVIQGVVRGVAAGIGLASEAHTHNKDKKQRQAEPLEKDPHALEPELQHAVADNTHDFDFEPEERHEVVWDLDAAQDEALNDKDIHREKSLGEADIQRQKSSDGGLADYNHREGKGIEKPEIIVAAFIERHPAPAKAHVDGDHPLALPVVIPQRRPKARDRGFIRAYAPLLEPCGIDESTFLEMIHDLNVLCIPDPKIMAVNLCSMATMMLPTLTSQVISQAIYQASLAASEAHARSKMNRYLDLMNEQFFKPRGLYCLVMTWVPNDSAINTDMNLMDTLTKELSAVSTASSTGSSKLNKAGHALRASSGQGAEFEFPETAPLVFPGLDSLASYNPKDPEGKKTMSKLGNGKRFVDQYLDKRAHAKWAGANMDSKMAHAVKTSFTSVYADPNHPAASGDLLALVTAGKISRMDLMAMRGGMGGGFGGGYGGGFGGGGGFGQGRGFGRGFGQYPGNAYGGRMGGYPNNGYPNNGYGAVGWGYGRMGRFGGRQRGGLLSVIANVAEGGTNSQQYNNQQYANQQYGGRQYRNQQFNNQQFDDPMYNEQQYNNQQFINQQQFNQQQFNQQQFNSPLFNNQQQFNPQQFDNMTSLNNGVYTGWRGTMGVSPLGVMLGGGWNLLHKNILYLMIVNLPTEEEMAEAAAAAKELAQM